MYTKNKRGLSAVVTTLLIILLTIIAVGIIWVVIRNLVEQGSQQIDITTQCASLDVRAVSVVDEGGGNYTVTLTRRAGGGDIGGVKIVIFNQTTNTGVLDFGQTLKPLETKSKKLTTNVFNASRMEFTPYLLDSSGNEQLCQTSSFSF
jgi:flagellin-like protein